MVFVRFEMTMVSVGVSYGETIRTNITSRVSVGFAGTRTTARAESLFGYQLVTPGETQQYNSVLI